MTHFQLNEMTINYHKSKKEVYPVTSKKFLSILFPSKFNPYVEIRSLLINKNCDLLPFYEQLSVNIMKNKDNFILQRHKKDLDLAFKVPMNSLEIFKTRTCEIIFNYLDEKTRNKLFMMRSPTFAKMDKLYINSLIFDEEDDCSDILYGEDDDGGDPDN